MRSMRMKPVVPRRLTPNWLRVLGTTECPQIDQSVRQQLHPIVSLLNVLKTQEQPLEFVLPRKGSLDTASQCMDSFIEEPLASSLGGLAIARVFFDVRNHASIEDHFPIVLGTISVVFTGATGRGASTEPWLSVMAITFSPFWCL